MQGFRSLYFNTTKLIPKLKMLKADGSYMKEIVRIEKQDLLILDDFGIQQLDVMGRRALLEIIEDRYGRASTKVVSQIKVTIWFDTIVHSRCHLCKVVHIEHRIKPNQIFEGPICPGQG